jgi:hypothetical protein
VLRENLISVPLGDILKHATLNDVLELDPVMGLKAGSFMEMGLTIAGGRREHAIEHHEVVVVVGVEDGAETKGSPSEPIAGVRRGSVGSGSAAFSL